MDVDVIGQIEANELLRVGVPSFATVAILAVLTLTRPNLGWPLLIGTTFATGIYAVIVGGDFRAEMRAIRASRPHLDSDAKLDKGLDYSPGRGYLTRYCMLTAMLGIVYIMTMFLGPVLF